MIVYPLDVTEPYQIVMLLNDNRCLVRGRSKIIRTNKDGRILQKDRVISTLLDRGGAWKKESDPTGDQSEIG